MNRIARLVALGASNLTRGFGTVVSMARAAWGPELQVVAALGYGRSYGAPSRVLVRSLPGILESGLWRRLEVQPELPTRAVVTDVGNDILYGFSAERLLAWVAEALGRLLRVTHDVTLTDLPLANVRRLSRRRYLALRSVLFPSCRLSLAQVLETCEAVHTGLAALAGSRGVRLVRLDPAWYGRDPIHIRRSSRRSVWSAILGISPGLPEGPRSLREEVRLSLLAPERRWLLGIEQSTPQAGAALPLGGRVWLY